MRLTNTGLMLLIDRFTEWAHEELVVKNNKTPDNLDDYSAIKSFILAELHVRGISLNKVKPRLNEITSTPIWIKIQEASNGK